MEGKDLTASAATARLTGTPVQVASSSAGSTPRGPLGTHLGGPATLRLLADVFEVAPRQPRGRMRHSQQLGIAQVAGVLPQNIRPAGAQAGGHGKGVSM